jgi:hypothetical protein
MNQKNGSLSTEKLAYTANKLLPEILAVLAIVAAMKFRYPVLRFVDTKLDLKDRFSYQLHDFRQHPTPLVQAIAILADEVLWQDLILQLHQYHMCGCQNCLQRGGCLEIELSFLARTCCSHIPSVSS